MRTRVGYAGGRTEQPTYRDLADHTEAIQIDFDPSRITYGELLGEFWSQHDPTARAWSTQYKAILFFHDEEQERLGRESAERLAARIDGTVRTEIVPAARFWNAEDYHQKYSLRGNPVVLESFRKVCPGEAALRDSTAAARLNAHLAGDLPLPALRTELVRLGLEVRGEGRLTGVAALPAPAAAAATIR